MWLIELNNGKYFISIGDILEVVNYCIDERNSFFTDNFLTSGLKVIVKSYIENLYGIFLEVKYLNKTYYINPKHLKK